MSMMLRPYRFAGYGGHRYWRLNIASNAAGNNGTGITEIEMRESFGGSDVTGSGTAFSAGSGTDSGGNDSSKAFDNSTATQWLRLSTTNTIIGYDFGVGVTKAIVEVAVTGDRVVTARSPATFTVQYSDDGTNYTTAFSVSTADTWTLSGQRVFPEATPAAGYYRCWRLFCTNNNGGSTLISITDLEFRDAVSGTDQTPIADSDQSRTIASSTLGSGFEAFRAFDANATTGWGSNGTTNGWIGQIYATPKAVPECAITVNSGNASASNARCPKDVILQGSQDGVTWDNVRSASLTAWAITQTRTL